MNEYTASNGVTVRRTRHGYLSFSNLDLGALTGITLDEEAALREYFESYPERKPWEDAKPEEAWLLTIDGKQWVAVVDSMLDFSTSVETFVNGAPEMARISDGRRIWPEDA